MASSSSDSIEKRVAEISTKPLKDINILLLGETGVGKSTWINGIANYLTYDTLEEAVKNEVVVLIPSQFTMTNDNYEEITIPIGAKDPNEVHMKDQSTTQYPRTYCLKTTQFNIRIIDTPGIGDTRGVDQDKENFQHIMDHLSSVDVIHGIYILLKPNNERLGVAFRSCITELLTQLQRAAAKNIAFCFTNARSTSYRPGDTLSSLRTLLTNKNVISTQIPLEEKTVNCLDNEAFRFLAAVKAGQNFDEDEQANFSKSWETSVKETARLLNYIQTLKPHHTINTVTLHAIRQTIIKLAKPLADVSENIRLNITLIDDKKKELEGLDSKEHDIKAAFEKLNCELHCEQTLINLLGISVQAQLHTIEGRIQATKAAVSEFEKRKCDLQWEQTVINRTTAKYAVFLKENSITPYNNSIIKYMDYLIGLEESNVKDGGENYTLDKLEKLKAAYEEEEQILLESLRETPQGGHVSLDDIQESFQQLFDLPINGSKIKGFLDTANKSEKICHRKIVCEARSLKPRGRVGLMREVVIRVTQSYFHKLIFKQN